MEKQISCATSGCAKSAGMGSRASSLDVLKCFAAYFVVCIHFGMSGIAPIVRCAVPIFFVITGYYYPMMEEKGKFWKHIKKLLIMLICATLLYAAYDLQHQIRHNTINEWISETFTLRHIVKMIVYNIPFFSGYHLWYFYAVLYCLIIFHYVDKWQLTKWLRYATPLLLLTLFITNFKPVPHLFTRTFLFIGLPCMMIGRCIREGKDKALRFLSNERYVWVYTFVVLLLIYGEKFLHDTYSNNGKWEVYILSLPLFLPYFYWALRHPHFGEGSWLAIIGRKYSAYIYIFHVLVGVLLSNFMERGNSTLSIDTYSFTVFIISLCLSWLFVRLLNLMKSAKNKG